MQSSHYHGEEERENTYDPFPEEESEDAYDEETERNHNFLRTFTCMKMEEGVEEVYMIKDCPDIKYCKEDYLNLSIETQNEFERRTPEWHVFSSKDDPINQPNCIECKKKLVKIHSAITCGGCIRECIRKHDYYRFQIEIKGKTFQKEITK